ncbi:hypothetical protein NQ317_009601 [Molorchus minor]|uniref:CHK kinase-like domain-containing protein n=1 Tax=Molorchus minor TaxID=1323400 RepID=A0ABQ9IUD8_9CUCU|nr:hypothetical protein NQ317_009601 [Molorchus minor]
MPIDKDFNKEISFKKELLFYRTFLGEIKKLGLEEISKSSPKCYICRQNEYVVLEDLYLENYKPLAKENFTRHSLLLVVKQLVSLHACSFLYEEIMNLKARLKDFKDDIVEEVCKSYEKCRPYRNVLCQGNLSGKNLFFKADKNGVPSDCCISNYGMAKYCPPSFDLLLLLYLNTDRETREKYTTEIVEKYYLELSAILKNYGFDLKKIYTYKQFLDSCILMKPMSIVLACSYIQGIGEKRRGFVDNDTKQNLELLEELYDICIIDKTISVPLPQLIPQFLTPLRHVFFNTTLTSFDAVSSISNCKLNQPAELRDLGAVTTAVSQTYDNMLYADR